MFIFLVAVIWHTGNVSLGKLEVKEDLFVSGQVFGYSHSQNCGAYKYLPCMRHTHTHTHRSLIIPKSSTVLDSVCLTVWEVWVKYCQEHNPRLWTLFLSLSFNVHLTASCKFMVVLPHRMNLMFLCLSREAMSVRSVEQIQHLFPA